ncbi:MAG: hypothetical protein EAZ27_01225 [Cytophagales bacterium]|nr:MAG: hypothetical protein EAZ27_01225 [Cytophagales bacterium]
MQKFKLKPILLIFSKLPVYGITLYPFIILKDKNFKNNKILMNHENIHIQQEIELLILPFYIWYLTEYFLYRLQGMSKIKAYHNISFEKEAYQNDFNLHYLSERKCFSFFKYLKKSK